MDEAEHSNPTKRGEASERIIRALADEFPSIHSRETFLDSGSLRCRHGRDPDEALSEREYRAAAKTLGRLVGDGTVAESLWLCGDDDKVQLSAAGLIAVSVDITSLRNAWQAWQDEKRDPDLEPTQERIAVDIMTRSLPWIDAHGQDGRLPLALTNVSIVHGSGAFDILITAIYGEAQKFLQYTREVVQRVPHVAGTHTMQVAQSYGFPRIETRADAQLLSP